MRRQVRGRARAVAALLLLLGTAAGATGCGHDDRPAARCQPRLSSAPLPSWADAGFSDPTHVLHTSGRDGRILGVLFGAPYTSPPRASTQNKVLWVARRSTAATLTIRATRQGTSQTVVRHVPLGPSTVDLPAAGCWRMDLSWGSKSHRQHDRVDLRYHARG